MKFRVASEVGNLKQVIVHRPGREMDRLTPSNKDELLFDDVVWTEGVKTMLDDMHKRKIDMADEIFVINVGGYIGSSTRSEIDYALAHGKKVNYLEKPAS